MPSLQRQMGNPGYFTTAIAVVAGICIAFGILYLFISARRTDNRRLNLLFGLFSFAYAGAILGARSGYLADSLDAYATAARVSTLFAATGFTLLIWYVAEYTAVVPKILLAVTSAVFALVGLAALVAPALVIDVS
ncbi:MAG: hypothetical protein ACR2N7_12880 [Acidimicrobiia bacterium]